MVISIHQMTAITTKEIDTAIAACIAAAHRRDGAIRAPSQVFNHVRRALRTFGEVNPIGDADEKTASPGTYRPTGHTCPLSCAYLEVMPDGSYGGPCYTNGGNVRTHQKRAHIEIRAAVLSFIGAATVAVLRGESVRLHVAGDGAIGGTDDPDLPYWLLIGAACDRLNRAFDRPVGTHIGWTYTHIPESRDAAWRARVQAAGIVVRLSDYIGPEGAIVVPFAQVPALRKASGQPIAKCPAQLRKTNCADCRLCWERPDLVIAFDPHGARKRSIDGSAVGAMQ